MITATKIYNLDECPICLESYAEAEDCVLLHCRHLFHERCIEKWLQMKNYCPCCQQRSYFPLNAYFLLNLIKQRLFSELKIAANASMFVGSIAVSSVSAKILGTEVFFRMKLIKEEQALRVVTRKNGNTLQVYTRYIFILIALAVCCKWIRDASSFLKLKERKQFEFTRVKHGFATFTNLSSQGR